MNETEFNQMLNMVQMMHVKLRLYRSLEPKAKDKEVLIGSLKRDIKALNKNLKQLESEL